VHSVVIPVGLNVDITVGSGIELVTTLTFMRLASMMAQSVHIGGVQDMKWLEKVI